MLQFFDVIFLFCVESWTSYHRMQQWSNFTAPKAARTGTPQQEKSLSRCMSFKARNRPRRRLMCTVWLFLWYLPAGYQRSLLGLIGSQNALVYERKHMLVSRLPIPIIRTPNTFLVSLGGHKYVVPCNFSVYQDWLGQTPCRTASQTRQGGLVTRSVNDFIVRYLH